MIYLLNNTKTNGHYKLKIVLTGHHNSSINTECIQQHEIPRNKKRVRPGTSHELFNYQCCSTDNGHHINKKNIQLMVRNIVCFLYSVYLLLFTFLLIFELESFSFYITLDTISLSLTVWDFLTDIMSSPCGCHHCLDICQTELYNRLQQTSIYTKMWHFSISLASCVLKDSPPNRNSFTISKPSKSIRM